MIPPGGWNFERLGLWSLLVGCLLCGCAGEVRLAAAEPVELVELATESSEPMVVVKAAQGWTETGVTVRAGEPVTVVARGAVTVETPGRFDRAGPREFGPEGTFLYGDEVAHRAFPLPAAAAGPAPCYCLIGRIGDGPPFYLGRRKSWTADRSGPLRLGLNDFDLSDNAGAFRVQVGTPAAVQPVGFVQTVSAGAPHGTAIDGGSVVLFYIDGLRPDVVREMAAMGHIPHINRLFVEGGAAPVRTYTAFPSDTITSNGTMWTGCFSDRHGLKGQVAFSRRTLHSQSYLEPLGPSRSARLLAPQGADKLLHETQAAAVGLVRGRAAQDEWKQSQTSGVPPLYAHLRAEGRDWATGVLPMMTEAPPLLWTRSLVRHMPYLQSQDAWKYVDDANAHFAASHLLNRESPVTIVWLPETDSVSHKQSRGQFGLTRRTIAEADVMIGRMVRELEARGRLASTYFILVSDHGHHGGRDGHLTHFDLANDFFYRPREMTADGHWVGGGLGISVRQHRTWNRHPEDGSRAFVFLDGDSDGAARVFLPRGGFRSGEWQGELRPADLLAYRLDEHLPPIDVVQRLASATTTDAAGQTQRPVDLVLMKLSDSSILIATADRGWAVIHRKQDERGRWRYRYTPVENVQPLENGEVAYTAADRPHIDPLHLLPHLGVEQLDAYHDERAWLRMTAGTKYPDAVVALTRHLLWQESIRHREVEFAPDLVVTARAGWYFGSEATPGTTHGYPLADAVEATMFFSGPNIRRGAVIREPARLVDLTPTILELTGTPYNPAEFDGQALRAIFEPADGLAADSVEAFYWNDVDLEGWGPLDYAPRKASPHRPFSINRPSSPFDLNNMAYSLMSLGDLSVLRLFDDILSPLSPVEQPVSTVVEVVDRRLRRNDTEWVAEGVETLDVPGIALADYSFTSLGNLQRANRAIDWVQTRGQRIDTTVAQQIGQPYLPGSQALHGLIDGVQGTFWETYRFGQRIIVLVLDEMLLNSVENGTDRTINAFRRRPAEIMVPEE